MKAKFLTGFMWASRIVLVLIVISMIYVVIQPSYNFAHWVPHRLLDNLGISYAAQLWLEQNADIALHLFGASLLLTLINGSQWVPYSNRLTWALVVVLLLCLAAEVVQHWIGRGFSLVDLLLGFCGAFVAYFVLRFTQAQKN